MTAFLRGLLMVWPGLVVAAVAPPLEPLPERHPEIRAIEFEGNAITEPRVMARELTIAVGEAAEPQRIQASRQALLNLGLFKQVIVDLRPVDQGVAVVFTVVEKWYLLPYPRLDYNSDREFAFGFKLDWSNVNGLNHDVEALISRQENAEEDRGDATEFEFDYFAPYFLESSVDFGLDVSHDITPIEEDTPSGDTITYKEDYSRFSVLALRRLTPGGGSQGWRCLLYTSPSPRD